MQMSRRSFIGTTLASAGVASVAVASSQKERPLNTYKRGALGKIVGELPPGRYDTHIHVYPGAPRPDAFKAKLNKAGFVGGCIYSECPFLRYGQKKLIDPELAMDNVIGWAAGSETIYPFYWINPGLPNACDLVDMAVEKGIYGFKVIRNDGLPVDERTLPVYQKMAKYNKPVTFHTGILWDSYPSSDYFRPANWEGLLHAPKLRFALAHISWPWCDECIAVYGKLLNASALRGDEVPEMFIDTTPGTPKIYRKEALTKIFTVGYDIHDHVQFGSDCKVTNYGVDWAADWVKTDLQILNELGVGEKTVDSVFRGSMARFLFGGDNSKRTVPVPDGVIKR